MHMVSALAECLLQHMHREGTRHAAPDLLPCKTSVAAAFAITTNLRSNATACACSAPMVLRAATHDHSTLTQCKADAAGVEYSSRNVLTDPDLREGVKKFSEWPTIPQVYIDGEFVGGSDILMGMHENGELSKMFKA